MVRHWQWLQLQPARRLFSHVQEVELYPLIELTVEPHGGARTTALPKYTAVNHCNLNVIYPRRSFVGWVVHITVHVGYLLCDNFTMHVHCFVNTLDGCRNENADLQLQAVDRQCRMLGNLGS
jgi:hypothetical protein